MTGVSQYPLAVYLLGHRDEEPIRTSVRPRRRTGYRAYR